MLVWCFFSYDFGRFCRNLLHLLYVLELVWQKYTNGHGFTFLYKECKSWFETVHTRSTNENKICLCRKGIYELTVESSSTTMAMI